MTDVTASVPLAIRHFRLPRAKFPKLGVGASITTVFLGITQAYRMAYVDPFKTQERRQMTFGDVDLEGRDPNW